MLNEPVETSKRIKWIDACKGFTILLVVMGHVVDGYLRGNIYTNYSNVMKFIYQVIYSFHMPLFLLLSGYVFKIVYFKDNEIKKTKLKAQLINIFILFTVFSIFQWIIKILFANYVNTEYTIKDLLCMYIKPMPPYWYLYDLFIFYLLGIFLDRYKKNYKTIILLTFISSCIGSIFLKYGEIFRCMKFLLFFVIGMFWENIKKDKFKSIMSLILIIVINLLFRITSNEIINSVLNIINALAILYTIITIFNNITRLSNNKVLNYLGQHSLEIYVLHCFFTAFNRKLFLILGINNFYINFILNCVVSVLISILISTISQKLKIYKYIFTPGKVIEKQINNN